MLDDGEGLPEELRLYAQGASTFYRALEIRPAPLVADAACKADGRVARQRYLPFATGALVVLGIVILTIRGKWKRRSNPDGKMPMGDVFEGVTRNE